MTSPSTPERQPFSFTRFASVLIACAALLVAGYAAGYVTRGGNVRLPTGHADVQSFEVLLNATYVNETTGNESYNGGTLQVEYDWMTVWNGSLGTAVPDGIATLRDKHGEPARVDVIASNRSLSWLTLSDHIDLNAMSGTIGDKLGITTYAMIDAPLAKNAATSILIPRGTRSVFLSTSAAGGDQDTRILDVQNLSWYEPDESHGALALNRITYGQVENGSWTRLKVTLDDATVASFPHKPAEALITRPGD